MNRFSFLGDLSAKNEAGSSSRGMKPAVFQADESELFKPRFIILPHCPTKKQPFPHLVRPGCFYESA